MIGYEVRFGKLHKCGINPTENFSTPTEFELTYLYGYFATVADLPCYMATLSPLFNVPEGVQCQISKLIKNFRLHVQTFTVSLKLNKTS